MRDSSRFQVCRRHLHRRILSTGNGLREGGSVQPDNVQLGLVEDPAIPDQRRRVIGNVVGVEAPFRRDLGVELSFVRLGDLLPGDGRHVVGDDRGHRWCSRVSGMIASMWETNSSHALDSRQADRSTGTYLHRQAGAGAWLSAGPRSCRS